MMGPLSVPVMSLESSNGEVYSAAPPPLDKRSPVSPLVMPEDKLKSYETALQQARDDPTTAASILYNMSLLHRQCGRYQEAIHCLSRARDKYHDYIQEEEDKCATVIPDYVETLQLAAAIHQNDLHSDTALSKHCHEQAVGVLLQHPLEDAERHMLLLSESLASLVNLHLQRGEESEALAALEDLMDMLRGVLEETDSSNKSTTTLQARLADACITYSTLQMERGQWDVCQEVLQEALQLRLEVHEAPSHPHVLEVVQHAGRVHERADRLDRALQCFETVLHAQSEACGQSHVNVATALIDVAQIFERQGNSEGALDLYREALRIYRSQKNNDSTLRQAEVHCRMGNILLSGHQVDDAVVEFEQALSLHDDESNGIELANVYHGLGRAYMEQKRFSDARGCLLKSSRLLGSASSSSDGDPVASLLEQSTRMRDKTTQEVRSAPSQLTASSSTASALLGDSLVPTFSVQSEMDQRSHPPVTASSSTVSALLGESLVKTFSVHSEKTDDTFSSRVIVRVYENANKSKRDREWHQGQAQKWSAADEVIVHSKSALSAPDCPPLEKSSSTTSAASLPTAPGRIESSTFADFDPFTSPPHSPKTSVSFDPYSSPPIPRSDRPSGGHLKTTVFSIEARQANVDVSELGSVFSNTSGNEVGSSSRGNDLFLPSFESTLSPRSLRSQSSDSASSSPSRSPRHGALKLRLADRREISILDITDEGIEASLDRAQTSGSDEFKSAESQEINEAVQEVLSAKLATWTSDYSGYDSASDSDEGSVSRPVDDSEFEIYHETETFEPDVYDEQDVTPPHHPTNVSFNDQPETPVRSPESGLSKVDLATTADAESRSEGVIQQADDSVPVTDLPPKTPDKVNSDVDRELLAIRIPMSPRNESLNTSQFSPGATSSKPAASLGTTIASEKETIDQLQRTSPQTPRKSPDSDRSVTRHSPRQRLAKALSSRFRRRRSGGQLESMPENDEHVPETPDAQRQLFVFEEDAQAALKASSGSTSSPGFITFVSTESSPSADDNLSQITYNTNDFKTGHANKFWWETTYEAVVGAAEQFLSAESIHDVVKSRKSEWSSVDSTEEESDPFEDLSDDDKESLDGGQDTDLRRPPPDPFRVTSPGLPRPGSGPKAGHSERTDRRSREMKRRSAKAASSTSRRHSASPRPRQSRKALQAALEEHKDKFGPKSAEVAETLTELALAHRQVGQLNLAVEHLLEALRIRKSLGERQEIARALHTLADTYCEQKHFRSALAYYLDAQWIEKSFYGDSHPEIANTMNKIGRVHAARQEYDVAMQCHQEALQVLNKCLGDDLSHPAVTETLIRIGEVYYQERNSLATIRSNSDDYQTFIETGMLDVIARAHEERGNYRMAIAFLEEKIHMMNSGEIEKAQDDLASTLTSLGTLSCKAGVYLEALDYYERVQKIQTKLGCNRVQLAKARVTTATVEFHLSQYKKSLGLFQDALCILRENLGSDHIVVAECLYRIGLVQIELAEFDAAERALEECFDIQEKHVGNEDHSTLRTRLALGRVLMSRCEYDEAIDGFSAVLEIQRCSYGRKHPEMASTLFCIGRAYEWKYDLTSAMKFYEESFKMGEEFLGRDHPVQASTLHRIAVLHGKIGNHKKALHLCERALEIRKETLGERHFDVATTLCSIAGCFTALGRFKDAAKYYEDAIPMTEQAVGVTHPAVAEIYVGLGGLQLKKCQFTEAKESVKKALGIYKRSGVPSEHPLVADAEVVLDRIEHDEMLCV